MVTSTASRVADLCVQFFYLFVSCACRETLIALSQAYVPHAWLRAAADWWQSFPWPPFGKTGVMFGPEPCVSWQIA